MQENSALGRALAVVRELRARCPWDRSQTRETLRPYLVEEVLELDQALAEGDPRVIRAELSDLLLHLAFQVVLAEERKEFDAADLADDLEAKMRRRHPHLFELGQPEPWERIKRRERRGSTLSGVLPTLPPLLKALRLQERAASVGFDWPNLEGPLAKIGEELDEVRRELPLGSGDAEQAVESGDPNEPGSPPTDKLIDEIGDLLFAIVNLARKVGVQPSIALDRSNRKFVSRFEALERLCLQRGIDLEGAGLKTLDRLWDEVKEQSQG